MPSIDDGGMARYDIENPEDIDALINSGLIWRGGPKAQQKAIARLIATGERPANLPANIAAALPPLPEPPVGEVGTLPE